ncbi:NUDIX domain-containing protein [Candidatus Uhrbacteria bacterium]|nr:NUDIX domain-containing protein [Candidatus Uhrbacteria bacterium]
MPYERSVGAIVFRRGEAPDRELYFLLLRYPGGYWEFPRGHVEVGEREQTTAVREIQEETGITGLKFVRGFRERYRFHFRREGQSVTKDAIIYLAEAPTWAVVTSEEHFGYVWVTYDDALAHLKFENSKAIMRAAHAFFARRRRGGRGRAPETARKSAA